MCKTYSLNPMIIMFDVLRYEWAVSDFNKQVYYLSFGFMLTIRK